MTTAVPLPYQATGPVTDSEWDGRRPLFGKRILIKYWAKRVVVEFNVLARFLASKSAMVRLNRLIVDQACKFQALALPPAEIIVARNLSTLQQVSLRKLTSADDRTLEGSGGVKCRKMMRRCIAATM